MHVKTLLFLEIYWVWTTIHASMEKKGSFAKFSFIFKKGDTATLLFCEVMIWLLNTTFIFIFFYLDRRLLLKKDTQPACA